MERGIQQLAPGRSNMCLDIDSPHPGTITTCNCFTLVSGQEMGLRPCMDIAEDARITVSQLESWNPWVGTDCDAGVYAGLGFNDLRAVCIRDGGGSSSSSSSSSSNSATVTNGPTTTMTSPSAPTQPGIPSGCTKYHTAVAGDGCWDIANAYGITLDQFYQWNPAGKNRISKAPKLVYGEIGILTVA